MIDDLRSLSARLIAASPFAMSIAEARAQTQERRRTLLAQPLAPEPTIAPEPIPALDDLIQNPARYAREFWGDARVPKKPSKPSSKRKPSERRRGPFRVISGDLDVDK